MSREIAMALGGMALIVVGSIMATPLTKRWSTRFEKNVNLYSKQDLQENADVGAEINEEATRRTGRAFKEGINDADETKASAQKFCSQCGSKISKSSKFCSHCGAEQN